MKTKGQRKYPATDEGRRRYIEDGMKIEASNATPWWVELIIVIIITPILIPCFIYAGIWMLIDKLRHHE